jgi:protein-tyrosine phosphatase
MSRPAMRIVFVCTGNICRSPTAEVVMRALVDGAGLAGQVEVSSAGTGDWHAGEGADPRAVAVLRRCGYDPGAHVARVFEPSWFAEADLVVALDRSHERELRRVAGAGDEDKLRLLLDFDPEATGRDVPDPYYGGAGGFEDVLALIERGCRGLLEAVRRDLAA